MFLHPEIASQLIRDRQRQMLAEASQRRLLRHPAIAESATPATRIIRRLADTCRVSAYRNVFRFPMGDEKTSA